MSQAGPPPDIVSDLNMPGPARSEANSEVQACLDFIDCLLRAPDMVEIPREGASSSGGQERDRGEVGAVNLPLKQQRETLLC